VTIVHSERVLFVQEVVGGFAITPQYGGQIKHVFSRIVYALRIRFQCVPTTPPPATDADTSLTQDCSIQQWLNGAKVVRGQVSAMITLTDDADGRIGQLIITCRGPVDQRRQLFFLQVLLLH